MKNTVLQQTMATQFRALHHQEQMLVLPNIWDPLGAALLEDLGYPAIATASASVAFTNGYNDGENIPFEDVLDRLTKIVNKVKIPVTADIESGYASNETELERNITKLINTGIAGINLEDFDQKRNALFSIEEQCQRIKAVRTISDSMDIPLVINARTDVHLRGNFTRDEEKLEETMKRGQAYFEVGADCIFPIAMKSKSHLKRLIETLQSPVNVLALPGIPTLIELKEIGVTRLSLGPGFLKIAIKAMRELAVKLKNYDGLDEITDNHITSDYLKNLVLK